MEKNKLVELKNIVKAFNGEPVLRSINLDVHDNEFMTLLGPSGCGKTTTLRIIGGFATPDSGDVFFDGVRINDVPPHKRQVNTVFQKYALFPHLNVYENVAFALRLKKTPEREVSMRVAEMLELVNLSGFEKRSVNYLSGGQQQRVAIARALVKMPRILLLDEPFSNLDARLRLQTREEIRKIQRKTGITTVFVTHDQEEAMSISDLIAVMKGGDIQQIGKPQEVYDNPENLFVAQFLGTPPINCLDGVVEEEQLILGGKAVLPVPGVKSGKVTVGIRPEGFVPCKDGAFAVTLSDIEVIGRDISVLFTHENAKAPVLRAIVGAENAVEAADGRVAFDLKPNKVFLFDAESGKRLPVGKV